MNVLIGVISPAAIWVIPRSCVDDPRRAFPHHQFLDAWDRETINRLLPEADAAFTPFVDRNVFAASPRLRWIQSPAVGVGSLLFPELLASPVVVTSARGIRARSIAEHVIGVTIALARRFPYVIQSQARHHWAQDELEGPGSGVWTLHGRRLGILGFGSIGREIARLAAPFGLTITGVRRRPERTAEDNDVPPELEIVGPDRMLDVLAASDIIVLAMPHTADTKHVIGRHELDTMKRGALLINIARGPLVDDAAMVEALRDGRLGGAELDVFTHEPLDAASPYWDLPNVIVTPHVSGSMQDYWTPLLDLFTENLRRFERGKPLINVVDKGAGY